MLRRSTPRNKMKKKKWEIPKIIKCPNCRHIIETENYIGLGPDENTPLEEIHTYYDPSTPYYVVMCISCGHFVKNFPTTNKNN